MSSKIVQRPFKVLPLPDGTRFKSNTLTISDAIYDPSDKHEVYDHTGAYKVTASSYADDKHEPYNVFNGGNTSSWKTNYGGNTYIFKPKSQDYCKDPYLVIKEDGMTQTTPSIYQGGGSTQTKYTTMVGSTAYNGEWIQIQLPTVSPLYLFRYSILTPNGEDGISTFPKSFLLVGSKDGNIWNYIDLQTIPLTNPPDTKIRTPIVYDINSNDHYLFYRFVFIEMFPGNSILEINQINLFAFVEPTPNKNAIEEGFTNMGYSNFNISKYIDDPIKPIDVETIYPINKYDSTDIYFALLLTFLASAMIFLRFSKA